MLVHAADSLHLRLAKLAEVIATVSRHVTDYAQGRH
jgi:hypothetical protein